MIGRLKDLMAMLFFIHLLLFICLYHINIALSLFLFRFHQDQLPEKMFNTSVRMSLYL